MDEWALQCANVALKLRDARDHEKGVHFTAREVRVILQMLQVLRAGPK